MEHKQLTREKFFELTRFLGRTVGSTFGPAYTEEQIVFGAQMPGYGARSIPESVVKRWISFMKNRGMIRVCCLLPPSQLGYYIVDLLGIYQREFGETRVLGALIEDYHLCRATMLRRILIFLTESCLEGEPVVVHCAGGRGRTGFVHTAWLVHGRGFSVEQALEVVKKMGRNPCEAVERGNASTDELYALLQSCERR
ncbi:MAG: protein phosphatase [Proteobacteria bacterium]|nr:protein phosphatase [Pseudomonadota bacterium]